MAAHALRIAFTFGIVLCLHNPASADLVIKFYVDGGDVWMSLDGTGTVAAGSGTAPGDPVQFPNFAGDPFPGVSDSAYTFSNSTLNLNINGSDFAITAVQLINAGLNQSDLNLTVPGLATPTHFLVLRRWIR